MSVAAFTLVASFVAISAIIAPTTSLPLSSYAFAFAPPPRYLVLPSLLASGQRRRRGGAASVVVSFGFGISAGVGRTSEEEARPTTTADNDYDADDCDPFLQSPLLFAPSLSPIVAVCGSDDRGDRGGGEKSELARMAATPETR